MLPVTTLWMAVLLLGATSCAGAHRPSAPAKREEPSQEPAPRAKEPATAEPAPVPPMPAALPSAPPPAPDQPPPPELPKGTTILHIGDSFAAALGIDLNRELKEAGIRGVLKYQTATYIPTWASSKDLDGYLARYDPDLVLITLGANELEIPDPKERIRTIERLVRKIGDRPCVWVAPPLWKGARADLLDTIRESSAPCLYLDSGALVPDLPRMRDRIHPSMDARRTWAKAVLGWLQARRVVGGARPWELRE